MMSIIMLSIIFLMMSSQGNISFMGRAASGFAKLIDNSATVETAFSGYLYFFHNKI